MYVQVQKADVMDHGKEMPLVHQDQRHQIRERITHSGDGETICITRIEVLEDGVQLGNHYHTFKERFRGFGAGILYTAPAAYPHHVVADDLPQDGWSVIIPEGTVHALVMRKGAILYLYTNQMFEEGANTHPCKLQIAGTE